MSTLISGAEVARQIEAETGESFSRAGIKKITGRALSKLYKGLKLKKLGTPVELFMILANNILDVNTSEAYSVIFKNLNKKYQNEIVEDMKLKNPYMKDVEIFNISEE